MVTLAFAVASSLFLPAFAAPVAPVGQQSTFSPKVSTVQKLAKARALSKRGTGMTGLTGFAELSIRNPHIEGKASLFIRHIFELVSQDNYVKGAPPTADVRGMEIYVSFKVARPNQAHLFSFYLDSFNGQDFLIEGDEIHVGRGPEVLHFVYVPRKVGMTQILLRPTTSHFKFSRVEIDILQ